MLPSVGKALFRFRSVDNGVGHISTWGFIFLELLTSGVWLGIDRSIVLGVLDGMGVLHGFGYVFQ